MVKVNFIRDTETISVDMPVGRTIMEAAKELGYQKYLPIVVVVKHVALAMCM